MWTSYWLDILALVWFLVSWIGYGRFAKRRAKSQFVSLSVVLHHYRNMWMKLMLKRSHRVSDAALLANLERQVTFLASTTILVLAGLMTVLSASDDAMHLLSRTLRYEPGTEIDFAYKVFLLVVIFTYAFFTFTWALRQYGFCSVLMGAAPEPEEGKGVTSKMKNYAKYASKVIDQAAHSHNYGLRSYYFAMAAMAWFINGYCFIIATSIVVIVLYRREFRSKTLLALANGLGTKLPDQFDKNKTK